MRATASPKFLFILSMTVFGTIGLFVRWLPIRSGELALYRAGLAAVLLLLYLLVTGQRIRLKAIGKALPLLLLSGIALGFNWILLFQAYQYTTVSVATLSYYFAPVLVTLACPLLFREKLTGTQWFCFAMATVGIVLITGLGDLSAGRDHLLGIAYGLGAACLYATVILLNKYISGVEGIQRTFLQFLAAAAVLLPYVLLTGGTKLSVLDGPGWVCLLTVGLLHTGVTYCMYFSSVKALPGQQIALLSYIDPLVAVVVSVVLLKESMTPIQALGGVLILGFTLLSELRGKKTDRPSG